MNFAKAALAAAAEVNIMPLTTVDLGLVAQLLCGLIIWHLAMVRSLHMFQLHSMQNMSYKIWMKKNLAECFGPRRVVPAAMLVLAAVLEIWYIALAALALFAAINRYQKAKKPLVWTARVKRLYLTSIVLTAIIFFIPAAAWRVTFLPAAAILLMPVLVMVYNAVNSPMEKAISNGYINDARRILRGHRDLKIIAITGSYGKTSVKHFLYQLLSVQYNVYMTPGNYNTTLGVVRAVREGLRPTHEIFLCEMGARHPGDIKEICDLTLPGYGVLTSIGPQHLETFGSQQAVTKTKLELADALLESGLLFVNMDSEIAAAQRIRGMKLGYGANPDSDYRVTNITVGRDGSSFEVSAPDGTCQRFHTKLLGSANVQNIAGAVAVAHQMGIPLTRLAPAVRTLKSVPHRLELKRAGDMTIIDDAYNSNPMGAKNALETLAMCDGGRVCVTPGLVELGGQEQQFNIELGRQAAQSCDFLAVVGDDPGRYVAQGALEAGFPERKLIRAANIEEALARVRGLALENKIVLLLNDLPDNYK